MKLLFLVLFITLSLSLSAQSDSITVKQSDTPVALQDTIPLYKKSNAIPEFALRLPNKKWFTQYNLKEKTPTLILYFSPDCGHCQMETETLLSHINELKKLQIIMVTSRPFEDMVSFSLGFNVRSGMLLRLKFI